LDHRGQERGGIKSWYECEDFTCNCEKFIDVKTGKPIIIPYKKRQAKLLRRGKHSRTLYIGDLDIHGKINSALFPMIKCKTCGEEINSIYLVRHAGVCAKRKLGET